MLLKKEMIEGEWEERKQIQHRQNCNFITFDFTSRVTLLLFKSAQGWMLFITLSLQLHTVTSLPKHTRIWKACSTYSTISIMTPWGGAGCGGLHETENYLRKRDGEIQSQLRASGEG